MADIRVPTLGESVTEATVGKWFKQPGEAVAVDEPVVELETDKVTLEVPAPATGVLSDIAAKTGDTVGVAALLGRSRRAPLPRLPKPRRPPPSRPPPSRPKHRNRCRLLRLSLLICRYPRQSAKWRPKAASTPPRSPARACTARSPRAT